MDKLPQDRLSDDEIKNMGETISEMAKDIRNYRRALSKILQLTNQDEVFEIANNALEGAERQ